MVDDDELRLWKEVLPCYVSGVASGLIVRCMNMWLRARYRCQLRMASHCYVPVEMVCYHRVSFPGFPNGILLRNMQSGLQSRRHSQSRWWNRLSIREDQTRCGVRSQSMPELPEESVGCQDDVIDLFEVSCCEILFS
jgi:hypothetical protein